MTLRSLAIAMMTLMGLVALPLAAQAYPAQTTGDLNVRTGPGTGYHRIGVLPRGTVVDVEHCHRSWCHIWYHGRGAWVSGRYLGAVHTFRPRVQRRYYIHRPYYEPRYFRRPGVSFYFGFGG